MSKISIKGMLIGGIVDIVTSVVLDIPFAIYVMPKVNISHVPREQLGTGITAAIHSDVPLYVLQLLVGLTCSVLGGYTAAWLARRNELLNGALSSFLCVALGIYTIASSKDPNALWVQMLMLVASPAMALLGGDLMRRRRHTRVQPA